MPLKYEEIYQAKRQLLLEQRFYINRQLNELTHPGRLPPELLSEIFMNICPYDPMERTSHGVLTASHVCRRWRVVALDNPLLWTHVEMDRTPDYIKMVLQRSRDCLLDVSKPKGPAALESDSDDEGDDSSSFNGNCVFPLIWPEIHRIRSFILPESPSFRHLPTTKLSAPHLLTYFEDYSSFDEYRDDHPLLPLLDTPRLQHAKLMTPSISALWSLADLVYLELHWEADMADDDDDDDSEAQSFKNVMSALACLPRLSTLRISLLFHLWRTDPPIPTACPTVSLQQLQCLEIISPCDIVGAGLFLEHAKFPLSPRIVITTENDFSGSRVRTQNLAVNAMRSILRRWSPGGATVGLHLQIVDQPNAGGVDDIKVAFLIPATEPADRSQPYTTLLESDSEEFLLRTSFPCYQEVDVYQLLPPLCHSLRVLTLAAHQRTARLPALQDMLGHLKTVEFINIVNMESTCRYICRRCRITDTHQLLFIGSDPEKVFTGATNNAPFLARLVTIKFCDTHITGNLGCAACSRKGSNGPQGCDECKCNLHYPRLVSWLTRRRALGLPLARLIFKNCSELDELRRMQLRFLVTDEVVEISCGATRRYCKL